MMTSYRDGEGSRFHEENDEREWLVNGIELIKEIDKDDTESKFLIPQKIDVLRCLGKFTEAIDLIDHIQSTDDHDSRYFAYPVLNLYKRKCKEGDRGVFEFRINTI